MFPSFSVIINTSITVPVICKQVSLEDMRMMCVLNKSRRESTTTNNHARLVVKVESVV